MEQLNYKLSKNENWFLENNFVLSISDKNL